MGVVRAGGSMILSPRDAALFSMATLTPDLVDYALPFRESLLPGALLRDYQMQMLLDALALMRQGYRRILIQAPTGAGKTVLAAAVLAVVAQLGVTGEFVVHRKELINQTSRSFTGLGLSHGFIAAKRPMDLTQSIILAGVQTLAKRLGGLLPPNLTVLDECHHAVAGTWEAVLEHYAGSYIIGLTATPQRLDGRGLIDHFDAIVLGPSVRWLIDHGYLSPFEYYAPSLPDLSGVRDIGGDLDRKATAAVMDRPKLIGDVVEHYLRLAPGKQGIVFAVNREHSRHIADAFNANGVPAMHVDGSMSDAQREYFDSAFRAEDIRIGVNVGLFGEGYDVPNVSYVGLDAPTKSLVNHLQACGRALRPSGDVAVIADHAGNAVDRQLGLPDDDREWSLEGRARKGRNTLNDAFSVTQCKKCFRVYPSSQRFCPGCQSEAPIQVRPIQQEAGVLSKLDREELRKRQAEQRKLEESSCTSYEQMLSLGRARGYKFPVQWAKRQCGFYRIAREVAWPDTSNIELDWL